MKTRIQTADPVGTRTKLKAAGLDLNRYDIGPFPAEWSDATLDVLIGRNLNGLSGTGDYFRSLGSGSTISTCCGGNHS